MLQRRTMKIGACDCSLFRFFECSVLHFVRVLLSSTSSLLQSSLHYFIWGALEFCCTSCERGKIFTLMKYKRAYRDHKIIILGPLCLSKKARKKPTTTAVYTIAQQQHNRSKCWVRVARPRNDLDTKKQKLIRVQFIFLFVFCSFRFDLIGFFFIWFACSSHLLFLYIYGNLVAGLSGRYDHHF